MASEEVIKCPVRAGECVLYNERRQVPTVKSGCCSQVSQHPGPPR